MPPTQACVPCHVDSLMQTSLFKPVADSLATGRPLSWQRVTRLPDFVFFNHAAHVRHGVSCETCHGPVHVMPVVYQAAPLTMEWCLQCHRAPERYVRLREAALSGWKAGDLVASEAVATTYDVRRLTSCSTCHRDAGRPFMTWYDNILAYGELWGNDEIFTWHPFTLDRFVDGSGAVVNFNYDNRQIRPDFIAAGLIAPYSQTTHPATIYKRIVREWTDFSY